MQRHAREHGEQERRGCCRREREIGHGGARTQAGDTPAHTEENGADRQPAIDAASIGEVEGFAAKGRAMRLWTLQAMAIGTMAPAMTKASVGSQGPSRSRNARTRIGSVIPETARPAPNSVPQRRAMSARIKAFLSGASPPRSRSR